MVVKILGEPIGGQESADASRIVGDPYSQTDQQPVTSESAAKSNSEHGYENVKSLGCSSEGELEINDDSSTREHILRLLLQKGTCTASQLAEILSITQAGVRKHLNNLVEEQLISFHQLPSASRGRPARHYILSPQGRNHFGQAYDDLALNAIEELIAAAGPGAVDRVALRTMNGVEQRFVERRAADPDSSPTQVLAQALNDSGFFACDDSSDIYQYHCPVAHVAVQYPQLCSAETNVLARLLGKKVERKTTIAHGHMRCQLHVVSLEDMKGNA